jgi:hypothetical protein
MKMKKISRGGNLSVYVPEPGDSFFIDQLDNEDEQGVTKEEFFRILDKASQPIKREAESDSKKTET